MSSHGASLAWSRKATFSLLSFQLEQQEKHGGWRDCLETPGPRFKRLVSVKSSHAPSLKFACSKIGIVMVPTTGCVEIMNEKP